MQAKEFFRKHKKAVASASAVVLLGVAVAPPARPQFGFGAIGVIAELVKQEAQYAQMIAMARNQLTTVQNNLRSLTNRQVWMGRGMSMLPSDVQDLYGETRQMTSVWNGNTAAAPGAWQQATIGLQNTGWLGNEHVGQSASLSGAASIEMTDAAGIDGMSTVAEYKRQQTANSQALQALQSSQQSLDPTTNSEIGQLNIMNAALLQSLRQQQSGAAVNTAVLEQLMVANTYRRNEEAEGLNLRGAIAAERETGSGQITGIGETLNTYIPK